MEKEQNLSTPNEEYIKNETPDFDLVPESGSPGWTTFRVLHCIVRCHKG